MHRKNYWSTLRPIAQQATSDGMVSGIFVLLVSALLAIIAAASSFPYDQAGPLAKAAISIAATIFMFGLLWTLWYGILRHLKGNLRIWITLLCFVLVGVFRGATLQGLYVIFESSQDSIDAFFLRIVSQSTQMPVILAIGTFVITGSRAYRGKINNFLERQATVRSALANTRTEIVIDRQAAINEVNLQLTREIEILGASSPRDVVDVTETLIDETIRPISHAVASDIPQWSLTPMDRSKVVTPWIKLWRKLPIGEYVSPLWTSVAIATYGLGTLLALYGFQLAVIVLVVSLPIASLFTWLTARVFIPMIGRAKNVIPLLIIGLLLIFFAASVFAFVMFVVLAGNPNQEAAYLGVIILIPSFMILVAVARGVQFEQERAQIAIDALDRRLMWIQARIGIERWQQRTQLARAVHGPFQAVIHSSLYELRKAVEEDGLDQNAVQLFANNLKRELRRILVEAESPQQFDTSIQRVTSIWPHDITVTVNVGDQARRQIDDDQTAKEILVSVLHDAAVNSVRHGQANRVELTVESTSSDTVVVTCVDNGKANPPPGEIGFGTVQLEHCSMSHQLERTESGHVLVIELPCGRSLEEVLLSDST